MYQSIFHKSTKAEVKNDFWFFSLAALLAIAIATGWNIWIKVAVILNSLVVLSEICIRILEEMPHE